MKKAISILISSVSILCLCFTACCSQPPDNNSDNNIESLYLQAVALGYEGTEEQFAAVISNDDTLKNQLDGLEMELDELLKNYYSLKNEYEITQQRLNNLYGEKIRFTAEKPIYKIDNDAVLYAEFDHHDDDAVSFENFLKFYLDDVKPKIDGNFYLLSPITDENDFYPNRHRTYSVYYNESENDKLISPMICERMMMYSAILGDQRENETNLGEGYVSYSLDIKLCLVPIQNYNIPLRLDFGNNNSDDYWGNNYINIYLGNTCIGTCYYLTKTYISLTWFKNYFNKNLLGV